MKHLNFIAIYIQILFLTICDCIDTTTSNERNMFACNDHHTLYAKICLVAVQMQSVGPDEKRGYFVCCFLGFPRLLKIRFATTATIMSAMIHSKEEMAPNNARNVNSSKSVIAIAPTVAFVLRTASDPEPLVAFT